ncbi:MAG: hypothetical protein Q9195_007691 [Heterodermia aff. obscurata]
MFDIEIQFARGKRFVKDDRRRKWVPNKTVQFVFRRQTPHVFAKPPPRKVYADDSKDGMREFEHIKKIGEGGQGRCDLVERKGDGKYLVYKQMKFEVDMMRSKGKNKPLEVAILKDILGPSKRIIKMVDWTSVSPTNNAFFLEYCSYGDLYNMIDGYHNNQGLEIPESFVWHTYLQLAEALTFIHEGKSRKTTSNGEPTGWTTPSRNHKPIVHRDIKPDNVFLRPGKTRDHYPEIVLADFGLATTRLRSCEGPDDFCGTMAYQGPELPLHSRAGDHWAIGACIHHMTTGTPPIRKVPKGRSRKRWDYKPEARKVRNVMKRGYSRELDDAMYKTLRTHPDDRLRGKALVESLERAITRWDGERILLRPWWERAGSF